LPICRATSAACELTPPRAVENSFRRDHATQIFRRRFDANEQNFFTLLGSLHRAVGVEINFPSRRTRTGGSPSQSLSLFYFSQIENGREQLIKLIRRMRKIAVSQSMSFSFTMSIGELERSHRGALAVARLEHEQLTFLHGELDVLHVLEMFFQSLADFQKFRVRLRHLIFQFQNRFGRAHAGDDVFALRR